MKLIVFDCDSTLSEIEGVDELARLKGESVFQEVVQLTHDAMDGKVPIDEVFGKRLDIIKPTTQDCAEIGQLYIEKVEPSALETLNKLRDLGWSIIILSGGFAKAIEPFAKHLNVEHIEAVPLQFDEQGNYKGFDASYPTTYNGGKPEIIELLKKELCPEQIVMIGDGVSDLETKEHVDLFIGFGRYTARDKVVHDAECYIYALKELLDLPIFSV